MKTASATTFKSLGLLQYDRPIQTQKAAVQTPLACGAVGGSVFCSKPRGKPQGLVPGLQRGYGIGENSAQVVPGTKTKYVPVTGVFSLIVARNGHMYLSVAGGVSTGDINEKGWSAGVSVRAGFFDSSKPLDSAEIDKELTGAYTLAGGHLGLASGSLVRNAFTGGIAQEYGIEGSTELGDVAGGQVLFGVSWRIH